MAQFLRKAMEKHRAQTLAPSSAAAGPAGKGGKPQEVVGIDLDTATQENAVRLLSRLRDERSGNTSTAGPVEPAPGSGSAALSSSSFLQSHLRLEEDPDAQFLTRTLSTLFSRQWAVAAATAVLFDSATGQRKNSPDDYGDMIAEALDWLFLFCPVGELPVAFGGLGGAVEVVRPKSAPVSAAQRTSGRAPEALPTIGGGAPNNQVVSTTTSAASSVPQASRPGTAGSVPGSAHPSASASAAPGSSASAGSSAGSSKKSTPGSSHPTAGGGGSAAGTAPPKKGGAAAPPPSVEVKVPSVDVTLGGFVTKLCGYGFPVLAVKDAVNTYKDDGRALWALLRELQVFAAGARIAMPETSDADAAVAAARAARSEEIETLVAIFGPEACEERSPMELRLKLSVDPPKSYRKGFSSDGACYVEAHFPTGCLYPAGEPPLLCVSVPWLQPHRCLEVTKELLKEAVALTDPLDPGPVLFDLFTKAQERLQEIAKAPAAKAASGKSGDRSQGNDVGDCGNGNDDGDSGEGDEDDDDDDDDDNDGRGGHGTGRRNQKGRSGGGGGGGKAKGANTTAATTLAPAAAQRVVAVNLAMEKIEQQRALEDEEARKRAQRVRFLKRLLAKEDRDRRRAAGEEVVSEPDSEEEAERAREAQERKEQEELALARKALASTSLQTASLVGGGGKAQPQSRSGAGGAGSVGAQPAVKPLPKFLCTFCRFENEGSATKCAACFALRKRPLMQRLMDKADTGEEDDDSGKPAMTDALKKLRQSAQANGREYPVLSPEEAARVSAQLKSDLAAMRASKDYDKFRAVRERLPAHKFRDEIPSVVAKNQVTIIAGETGCGKTTQTAQFILDSEIEAGRGALTRIICTQPRRISAMAVGERVAAERCERPGATVGYQIRLESKKSVKTRILFCTTGILLRRLLGDPMLDEISHVIVDEVHERTLDSDFLLIILRDLLRNRPSLRLVVMSATLNASLFGTYFSTKGILTIPGFTHPVKEHFLEDIFEATGYILEPDSEFAKRAKKGGGGSNSQLPTDLGDFGRMSAGERRQALSKATSNAVKGFADLTAKRAQLPGYSDRTLANIEIVDEEKINYELIGELIAHIDQEHGAKDQGAGAILVFLPGLMEITRLYEQLMADDR